MDIIGREVSHSKFGTGTIIKLDNSILTVVFSAGEKRFEYPSIFEKLMVINDEFVNMSIQQEIVDIKAAIATASQLERMTAILEQPKTTSAERDGRNQSLSLGKTTPDLHKSPLKLHRIPGKRSTYFVFQGSTFDRESRGGYIWAPIQNAAGNKCFHWERLLDVHAGDIIFHGFDGKILAVSIAKAECYDSVQPDELVQEGMWDKDGRRIDCDYIMLHNPIRTASFRDDILTNSAAKYSPFDKDGNGKYGLSL